MERSKHGFTRSELLVVIGVVFFLFLLIGPGTHPRARRAVLRTKCINNLSQISKATMIDVMDHYLTWATNLTYWNSPSVLTTLSARAVLECPADRGAILWPTNCTSVFETMGTSYAFAWTGVPSAGISGTFGANEPIKLSDSRLAMSSKKIIFFEPTLHEDNPVSDSRTKWHFDGRAGVASFLDGHAELLMTNYATLPPSGSVSNRYYY